MKQKFLVQNAKKIVLFSVCLLLMVTAIIFFTVVIPLPFSDPDVYEGTPDDYDYTKGYGKKNAKEGFRQSPIGPPAFSKIPTTISKSETVFPIIIQSNELEMVEFLRKFISFPERYFNSKNGVAAAKMLFDTARSYSNFTSNEVEYKVQYFKHRDWLQPSVIARLEAKFRPERCEDEAVIMGSHMDTIVNTQGFRADGNQPGADDCASGITIVMHSLKTLLMTKFIPCRPLEFHFYAFEEVSVAGSDNVATHYAKTGKRVLSYLNLDQSGVVMGLQYPVAEGKPKIPTMGLMDFTDPVAQALLIECIVLYTDIPREHIEEAPCGRTCSDQASWNIHGYSSAGAFEGSNPDTFKDFDKVNPDGSFSDVFENIDFVHLNRFVRQSIGFMIELSLAG